MMYLTDKLTYNDKMANYIKMRKTTKSAHFFQNLRINIFHNTENIKCF